MDQIDREKFREWGKKGGAPKKSESEKKCHFAGIHLTADEKNRLSSLVGKHRMKQSDLVRKLIFDGADKLVSNLQLAEAMKLRVELRKIGVNINQIAKKMNAEDSFIVSDKYRDQLRYLENIIKSILESDKY
jgi:hypothetical protein